MGQAIPISIHALHEESDASAASCGQEKEISIHALHEESDLFYMADGSMTVNFNPRSP